MKATRKQIVEPTMVVNLEFTEAEFKKFIQGLGNTSHVERVNAGMTVDQSKFFGQLFDQLCNQGLLPKA